MNSETKNPTDLEADDETLPPSGHGRMPLFLLVLWIANVSFFLFYLIKFAWPDLTKWLGK